MIDRHPNAGDPRTQAAPEPSDISSAVGHRAGRWFNTGARALSGLARRAEFLAILDQVIVSIANFLTGAVVGRACTKDEFGLYMLGLSIVFIVMAPQTSLISPPYTVFSPRLECRRRASLTGSVVVHQLLISFLIAIGLAVVAVALLGDGADSRLPTLMLVLALLITFVLFKEFARSICFANMNFTVALLLDSVAAVVQVLFLILLAKAGYLTATSAFLIIGIASGIGALAWLLTSRREILIIAEDVVQDLKNHLMFGKWLFFSIVIWNFWSNVYPWILTRFHGTEVTGVFAACMGTVAFANPLANAIGNFVAPQIAHSYARIGVSSVRKVASSLMMRIGLLVVPFCVALCSLGGWLAVLIYGRKYSGLGIEIAVLALSFLVTAIAMPLARTLQTMERPDVDFVVNLFPLVVMMFVGIPLVKNMGVLGAACGLLAGNLVAAGVRWVAVWRLTRSAR